MIRSSSSGGLSRGRHNSSRSSRSGRGSSSGLAGVEVSLQTQRIIGCSCRRLRSLSSSRASGDRDHVVVGAIVLGHEKRLAPRLGTRRRCSLSRLLLCLSLRLKCNLSLGLSNARLSSSNKSVGNGLRRVALSSHGHLVHTTNAVGFLGRVPSSSGFSSLSIRRRRIQCRISARNGLSRVGRGLSLRCGRGCGLIVALDVTCPAVVLSRGDAERRAGPRDRRAVGRRLFLLLSPPLLFFGLLLPCRPRARLVHPRLHFLQPRLARFLLLRGGLNHRIALFPLLLAPLALLRAHLGQRGGALLARLSRFGLGFFLGFLALALLLGLPRRALLGDLLDTGGDARAPVLLLRAQLRQTLLLTRRGREVYRDQVGPQRQRQHERHLGAVRLSRAGEERALGGRHWDAAAAGLGRHCRLPLRCAAARARCGLGLRAAHGRGGVAPTLALAVTAAVAALGHCGGGRVGAGTCGAWGAADRRQLRGRVLTVFTVVILARRGRRR